MGTNYFLWKNEELPTEATIDSAIHIGKHSAGWVFHFQSYPNASTLSEMKELTKEGAIYDEYLTKHSYEDFWKEIDGTKEPFNGREPYVLEDPDYPGENYFGSYEESGFAWTPVEFC